MNTLLRAVEILKAGGIVAIPTDTLYGLAADASCPSAIQKIFEVKKRAADQALPLLLPASARLEEFAIELPALAFELQKAYWPGPLTMVVKKASWMSAALTRGKDTIALRVPNHPLAQELLEFFPHGLAVTSANISGQPPARATSELSAGLADFVLEGGVSPLGQASTIIDLTQTPPVILREGALPRAALRIC